MINCHNTVTKAITLSVLLIGGVFGSAFAEDVSDEVKKICFLNGTSVENKKDCQESQKAASKPKSGCFSDGRLGWCYYWNPKGTASNSTLGNLLEDENFLDAFYERVNDLNEENKKPPVLQFPPIRYQPFELR